MSRPAGVKGATLYCARCDNDVPERAQQCLALVGGPRGGRGPNRVAGVPCGSRAFYRGRRPVRHIMGAALPDEPPILAEAPYPARRTMHGHR